MRIAYNACFGNFELSEVAQNMYEQIRDRFDDYREAVAEIVETIGTFNASTSLSRIEVAEVPEGFNFMVEEYDGLETPTLAMNEDYFRNMLRNGATEDEIVNYVKAIGNPFW